MENTSKYELVKKFMEIIKETYSDTPINIPEKDAYIRYLLLKEENEEYLEAAKNQNLEKVLDALTDILYVVYGTILKHGLQDYIDDAFIEVHKSNMSKKRPKWK
jgi:predicted HAD superfamily Cof-like phosphohydrolase